MLRSVVFILFSLVQSIEPTDAGLCSTEGLAGAWYDDATEDWMQASVADTAAGCELTTKFGTVLIAGTNVTPRDGILRALGISGEYHTAPTKRVVWSNGQVWGRASSDSETQQLQRRAAEMEALLLQMRTRVDTLEEQLRAVAGCTGCAVDGSGTAAPGSGSSGGASSEELRALHNLVTQVQEDVANVKSTPGRDGYCSVQPTTTWVYTPVVRYVRRRNTPDICTTGPAASTGPPGDVGVPSRVVVPSITNQNCRWAWSMLAEPLYAYKGDTLVFWRQHDKYSNIYLMKDKAAYHACDFEGATLVAGLLDLDGYERLGKNFTYIPKAAGVYYFASDKQGIRGDERKEYCWDPATDGTHPGQAEGWGRATKLEVIVLDPTQEVMAQCPLYDAGSFGVTGDEVDSESVARLKGTVAAISRQLIATEVRTQERVRAEGNSGLTVTRSRWQGTDAYFHESYVGSGPGNAHNHADFKYTIGMGEFGAVLNGVQFTTRHNDYSLLQPDDTLPVYDYHSSFPPRSKEMTFPDVPQSVLDKSSVDEQVLEMREYFRAFHEQDSSIRDYDKYFKANLCYLEGTWTEAQEDIAEPFASERHHIDADTWEDLHAKNNFLFNNGQKSSLENLPFLPSAFRSMRDADTSDDTFEPDIGQWFYRINCVPIEERIPTARFRVRNDLHVQMSRSTPSTRKSLAQTHRALYEVNPTLPEHYNEANPWPKSTTNVEYIDHLMQFVPGFDGPKGDLEDRSFGPLCGTYNLSATLNTAFYSRYYAMIEKDAMGQTFKKRGFNDLMFAAQTSHPRVSPQQACYEFSSAELASFGSAEDKTRTTDCAALNSKAACYNAARWDKTQVSGNATSAKCVWSGRCRYKKCWTQRWSYAIPLEVIYTTPITNWNPYNIPFHEPGTDEYTNVKGEGADGLTKETPFRGSHKNTFFRTPETFFKDSTDTDDADTSGGVTFVEAADGKVVEVRASGHWLLFPEIEGVGKVRQRYPIMPVHEQGSSAWKEAKSIEELLMGKETVQEIKDIIAETRASEYGVELRLMAGMGHQHTVCGVGLKC